jgi:hypothetical protein
MQFRWVAAIALWTLLSGPVFDAPGMNHSKPKAGAVASWPPQMRLLDGTSVVDHKGEQKIHLALWNLSTLLLR